MHARMTIHSFDLQTDQLRRLREQVIGIASELERLSGDLTRKTHKSSGTDPPNVISVEAGSVHRIIQIRHQRRKYLPADLFADPAWDMLLDLLHSELIYKRVSVSSLSLAANVPATTALRWIKLLVEQRLIVRQPDPADGRRVFVELNPDVSKSLRQYFAEVVQET
jgi:DNA-binding MarR family transcriptional regulator